MFGEEFDLRDVLAWCDMNAIESPDSRSDYGYISMRLKRARKALTRA